MGINFSHFCWLKWQDGRDRNRWRGGRFLSIAAARSAREKRTRTTCSPDRKITCIHCTQSLTETHETTYSYSPPACRLVSSISRATSVEESRQNTTPPAASIAAQSRNSGA